MGYGNYETPLGDAGYLIDDTCNEPDCTEKIHRGLDYLCGDTPGTPSDRGCGRWFCHMHLTSVEMERDEFNYLCPACVRAFTEEGHPALTECEECEERGFDCVCNTPDLAVAEIPSD